MNQPPRRPNGPSKRPPDDAPPPKMPPVDEVASAKIRLLEASESVTPPDPTAKLNALLRDHPYLAAGAALGAGLLVARVHTLRKLVTIGGMWAGKRMLARYLKNMAR